MLKRVLLALFLNVHVVRVLLALFLSLHVVRVLLPVFLSLHAVKVFLALFLSFHAVRVLLALCLNLALFLNLSCTGCTAAGEELAALQDTEEDLSCLPSLCVADINRAIQSVTTSSTSAGNN